MLISLCIMLLLFCFYPPIDGRMYYEFLFGSAWISILISKKLYEKIHWSVGISSALFFISGYYSLYSMLSGVTYPIPTNELIFIRGNSEILYSLVTLILFSCLLLFESVRFFKSILNLLFFGAIIDSFVLIFNQLILKKSLPFAMLNNNTADAAFIACMLPMAFEIKNLNKYLVVFMMYAIFICRSNTAMAGIFIAYASWLLTKESIKSWIKSMLIITPSILICSYFLLGSHFLGNSGRFDVWKLIWSSFIKYGNLMFGFGTGTFTVWGDAFQRAPHLADTGRYAIWYWLHLEGLEILFENGIIGLSLSLIVYAMILKRSYKKSIVFPIACVYGLVSMTEMPLRLFVTQLLGVCLMALAFNDASKTQEASENLLS